MNGGIQTLVFFVIFQSRIQIFMVLVDNLFQILSYPVFDDKKAVYPVFGVTSVSLYVAKRGLFRLFCPVFVGTSQKLKM
ncbi:hypothetical protein CA600_06320 [Paenibacillus sp. VTT E-133280]|nr:hypothetical protein CA600_06320 [Paenibacillus sp. VTT E-133280]